MTAPLTILAINLSPKLHNAFFEKDEKGNIIKGENGRSTMTKLGIGCALTVLSFDTVASISTFICGLLGAIGVMKINAIGSYSMIGVSCSITAAYAIVVICRLIQTHKKKQM